MLSSGRYELELSERRLANSLLILRMNVGTSNMEFKYLPLGQRMFDRSGVGTKPIQLAKTSAVVDTLRASKAGYKTQSKAISSYTGTVDFSLGTSSWASGACWKYNSATIGAADVSRWNGLATTWFKDRTGKHHVTWFDDDHKEYMILSARQQQPCRMTSAGKLTCTRNPKDLDAHTQAEIHGSSCLAKLATERTVKMGKKYRYGFEVCLPSGANSWKEKVLFTQMWAASKTNPPFCLILENGGDVRLGIKGDNRTPAQIIADNKNYQFRDDPTIVSNLPENKCQTFQIEIVADRTGAAGLLRIWHNGVKIYDTQDKFGKPVKVGYNAPLYMPQLGAYAFGGNSVPFTLIFDKIWFQVP
jgi:hypothetical protein